MLNTKTNSDKTNRERFIFPKYNTHTPPERELIDRFGHPRKDLGSVLIERERVGPKIGTKKSPGGRGMGQSVGNTGLCVRIIAALLADPFCPPVPFLLSHCFLSLQHCCPCFLSLTYAPVSLSSFFSLFSSIITINYHSLSSFQSCLTCGWISFRSCTNWI